MSTVRTKKNKNYTTISNVVLNDVALSWKAKGLAAYLFSKPDEWKIQREHLAKQSEDGISAVRSALQELEKFGYLVRQKTHGEKGIIEWEYILHEEPQNREPLKEKGGVRKKKGAKPPVENPPVENPPVENITLVSTDVVSTDVVSTDVSMTDQRRALESDRARAAPTPADSSRRRLDPPSANTEQPTPATDTSAVVRLQQILPTRNGSTPTVVGGRDRRSNAEYDTVCKAIESNGFGMMTPILADKVNAFMDAYPTDWIIRALATATAANKLRLDYVGGILENWKREGFGYDQRHHHRERGRNGVHPPATDSAADSRQRAYNERYTRHLADEINQVITRDAAAQQWAQLETEFPDYEYKELP
ncbi:MAG: DnaD domain protein [Desulfurellales bacterium]|nr:MAG: DnaD domain protein [Desulfurellales bacterium]